MLLFDPLQLPLSTYASTIPTPHRIVNTTHPHAIPLPCNNITEPCHCPNGSLLVRSATRAVIGAAARDVASVMDDCMNVANDMGLHGF